MRLTESLIRPQNLTTKAVVAAIYQEADPHQPVTTTTPTLAPETPPETRITASEAHSHLDELSSLLHTLHIPCIARFLQKRERPTAAFYFGKGKVQEIGEYCQQHEALLLVVDGELSGPQIRNMEALSCCQVLDRSAVILEIFSHHASTHTSRLQVQMAKWQYLLPKLVGAWSHFSRQKGGGVRSRGKGEKQLELDRREARAKIAHLRKKLSRIKINAECRRKSRQNTLKVALVGYTNSGKTTLMQGLTTATTAGEDQLFSTLSAQVKSISPSAHPTILLTDTVGFVRKLPHSLIESFRSTLQETLNAHLLIHIIDLSHPDVLTHMQVTHKVLKEIGAHTIDSLLVFNKVDAIQDPFLKKVMLKKYPQSLCISAFSKQDIKLISDAIWNHFHKYFCYAHITVATHMQDIISMIYAYCAVEDADYTTPGQVEFYVKAKHASLKKIEKEVLTVGASITIHFQNKNHTHTQPQGAAYLM